MPELEAETVETQQSSDQQARALEEFIVNNDDLLELERLLGRFNIFDALRVADVEIRHSNFLAWLLDPAESHGQGALFLRAILMDLLRTARDTGNTETVSPIHLDGADLSKVEIRREWRNIDILITLQQPALVVAVENKVKSGERAGQLDSYREVVETEGAIEGHERLFVFLTVEGDEPSEEAWVPYSYADVFRVIQRVCDTYETSLSEDVLMVLKHYLRVLKGQLMDDPKIEELCRQIYRNHRLALKVIWAHVGSPGAAIVRATRNMIEQDERWFVVTSTSKLVEFVPADWKDLLPPVGKRGNFDHYWAVLRFAVRERRAYTGFIVRPTSDADLRRTILDRLTRDSNEFGLEGWWKKPETMPKNWANISRKAVISWRPEDGPREEKILEVFKNQLDYWYKKLERVPAVLRPIIDEWDDSDAE